LSDQKRKLRIRLGYFSCGKEELVLKKGIKIIFSVVAGALIGFVNGFFGGGGGMLCVPLLEQALKKPVKTSHATALLIMLPVSVVSAAVYLFAHKLSWGQALPTGGGVLIGGLLGALLLSRLSSGIIRVVFALVMTAAGVKLCFF